MNPLVLGIFALLLVVMLILPYFSQRRKNQEYMNMINSLKVGDLVKTAGGIIGKITKITDKGEFKTVILETGAKEKSYFELDMSMIYCILKSTKTSGAKQEKIQDEPVVEKVEEANSNDKQEQTVGEKEKAETPKKSKKKTTKTK